MNPTRPGSKPPPPPSAATQRKLADFEAERRRKRMTNYVTAALVAAFTFVLILLFANDQLRVVFRAVGLEGLLGKKRGIYTDCSGPDAASSGYCNSKEPDNLKGYSPERGGGGAPFSLSGR